MASILTNTAAMDALSNLAKTQQHLKTTQNQISTGLKVASASDNAAYWSIAQTMTSDNMSLSAVSSALNLGASAISVASAALNSTASLLNQFKTDLVTAQGSGVDLNKIGTDIAALQSQMSNTATSASFSSVNWLSIDSANSTKNSTNIVSSFSRSTTGVSTGSIAVSLSTNAAGAAASGAIALYDTNTGGSKVSVNATGTVAADATATGSIKLGILDRARIGPGATSAVTGIAGITVSSATTSTQLSDYLSMVDQALNEVTTGQSTLGAASSRITLQQNFISSLSDAVTKGVGSLQDADMNQASTQLQALQVQQQLGVQSLSIANQNSQMILKLFNG